MAGLSRNEIKQVIRDATLPLKRLVDCTSCNLQPEYTVIEGVGSWTMPSNATSVSVHVITLGGTGSITVTTNSGTNELYSSQTVGWDTGNCKALEQPLTVDTVNASDVVAISYTLIN